MALLQDGATPVSEQARCDLVIACARLLYINGQGTQEVLAASRRLGRVLGLNAALWLRWGEVRLQLEEGHRPIWCVAANPAGVDMSRVVAGMQVIDDIEGGRLTQEAALKEIATIFRSPAFSIWLFAFASGAGATAMSVIFGVQQLVDASMIFVSAFLGALLRRGLARLSTNALIQPFCVSVLAGAFAAVMFRFQVISSLRLVALSPCVILVPGAHMLNGLADLISGRLHLGATRMVHAGLIVAAITTGLLFGLVMCDASLPLIEDTRVVPLWQHILAGGVAVAAFGVLFSLPLRQLALPVVVGALAQALRWVVLAAGFRVAAAALIASLAVGSILMPVVSRQRMPFAAIGFVAVVSMIPGSYLFTMAGGLVQIATGQEATLELIGVTLANGTNAMLIVLAISLGLVIPRLVFDYFHERGRSLN